MLPKGDVLSTAVIAAHYGTKLTSSLIPLCHPLLLTSITVAIVPNLKTSSIDVKVTTECEGRTGVEMEALTGVSTALLVLWDMLKGVAGEELSIEGVRVVEKRGGVGGDWKRD